MIDLGERERQIDETLRASGARLRSASVVAPVPELRNHRQFHRRGWLVGLATATVVIVGLVAIGTNRNQRASNDPARLRWIIADLPTGWKALYAFDPATIGTAGSPTLMNIYATKDVLKGPLLSVEGSDSGSPQISIVPASGNETNIEELAIGERRAVLAIGHSGLRVMYVEANGHWVRIRARNLDDASLGRIGQIVEWADGIATIPAGQLTHGLTLVASALQPIDPVFIPRIGAGVAVTEYSDTSSPYSEMRLTVGVPRAATLAVAALEGELTPTKIASALGWSFVAQPNGLFGGRTLYWERDGLAFSVTGRSVQEQPLLAAAVSVRPATDAEWQVIPRAQPPAPAETSAADGTSPADSVTNANPDSGAAPDTVASAAETVPAETIPLFSGEVRDVALDVVVSNPSAHQQTWSGTLPTGESWKVDVATVYNSIRVFTSIDGALTGGFSGETLPRPSDAELGCCNAVNVITANSRAAALRVVRSNGDRYTVELHDLPGNKGLRIAVLALPTSSPGQQLELIDVAGSVLQSMP
jgi:hypothetical protein